MKTPSKYTPSYEEDEITLKDILVTTQEFGKELWKYKFLILLVTLGFATIFFIKESSKSSTTTYKSALTFFIDEEKISPSNLGYSELGGIDSQFDLKKLVTLARSNRIIHQILLKEVIIGDKKDLIANHLISLYDYHNSWANSEELTEFYFSDKKLDNFSTIEHQVLNTLQDLVIGNKLTGSKGLANISYDNTGIVQLEVTTTNSALSNELIEIFFGELKRFYIEQSVGRLKKTHELLEVRAVEVQNDLENASVNLNIEYENSYNLSLNNSIDYLSELLESTKKEKDFIIELAEKEKTIAIELAEKEKAFLKEQMAIAEQEKQLDEAKIADQIKILQLEKEALNKKFETDLKFKNSATQKELQDIKYELAILTEEKKALEVKAEILVSKSPKRDKRRLIKIKEKLSQIEDQWFLESENKKTQFIIDNFKKDDLIQKFKDSLAIDQNEVDMSIANYKNALEKFNKEKYLNLDISKWKIEHARKVSLEQIDSVRKTLDNFKAEKSNALISPLTGIEENNAIRKSERALENELQLSEYLRTKKRDLVLDNLSRQVNSSNELYTSLLKNKQSIEFVLDNRTPEFQVIDQTFIPIAKSTQSSSLLSAFIGGFIGSFLSIGFFIGRKVIRDALIE